MGVKSNKGIPYFHPILLQTGTYINAFSMGGLKYVSDVVCAPIIMAVLQYMDSGTNTSFHALHKTYSVI